MSSPDTTTTTAGIRSSSSSSSSPMMTIRRAAPADAPALETLINAAFRDDPTTDVYLAAGGDQRARIDLVSVDSVLRSMAAPDDVAVFVGVEPADGAGGGEVIVGHFSLTRKVVDPPAATTTTTTPNNPAGEENQTPTITAWLALLAVSPQHQGRGHGGALVAHAESFARSEWAAGRLEFDVVNTRAALRAWYAARGYAPTRGDEKPFAYGLHPGWEGVLRGDLAFVDYGKDL